MCVCVCARVSLPCMNETVALLNLAFNFDTWLIVMFCLFVNAQYEWKGTKTNYCVHLNVTGE